MSQVRRRLPAFMTCAIHTFGSLPQLCLCHTLPPCPAVSTPCGHTFCKPCFTRAMDHGSKCPMCRTVLHVGRELAVTITLKNLLEKSFPGGCPTGVCFALTVRVRERLLLGKLSWRCRISSSWRERLVSADSRPPLAPCPLCCLQRSMSSGGRRSGRLLPLRRSATLRCRSLS